MSSKLTSRRSKLGTKEVGTLGIKESHIHVRKRVKVKVKVKIKHLQLSQTVINLYKIPFYANQSDFEI